MPGVTATTPVNHSYAYVGSDLQDTFGIDPNSLRKATSLRDSYFIGGGAGQMMSRLASTPDGILVSLGRSRTTPCAPATCSACVCSTSGQGSSQ